MLLITSCRETYLQVRACQYAGVSAVIEGELTLFTLWRMLEYGLDELGCQPGWVAPDLERRGKRPISADH